jgi:uncharacterized membrane protein YgcG
MLDLPAKKSLLSRRLFFRLAWWLFLASLLFPVSSGLTVNGPLPISVVYVYGLARTWSDALPGSPGALAFLPSAVLALALYTHILFLYTTYLRDDCTVQFPWKAFAIGAFLIDASAALVVPEFTHLPAYWIWLASIASIAVGFVLFAEASAPPSAEKAKKLRKRAADIDNGEVPPFVWALLACTLFWVAVSAGNHAIAPRDLDAEALSAPLEAYVNDRANVLKPEEAAALSFALQKLERATPNQVAIAIYPHAPAGSVEEFTIDAAERLPLGFAGLDSGALLFVFLKEREARLEVGYGLEGALTDADSHRILEEKLAPAFARGAYYDGLKATLDAVFAKVRDEYKYDRMPGKVTLYRKQLTANRPNKLQRIWRSASEAGIGTRIVATFVGGLALVIIWFALTQWAKLARNLRAVWKVGGDWASFVRDLKRGIGNLKAKRPFGQGMEKFDAGTIVDSVQLLFYTIGILTPAAAVVLIAGGGAFGGAGSMIHW